MSEQTPSKHFRNMETYHLWQGGPHRLRSASPLNRKREYERHETFWTPCRKIKRRQSVLEARMDPTLGRTWDMMNGLHSGGPYFNTHSVTRSAARPTACGITECPNVTVYLSGRTIRLKKRRSSSRQFLIPERIFDPLDESTTDGPPVLPRTSLITITTLSDYICLVGVLGRLEHATS